MGRERDRLVAVRARRRRRFYGYEPIPEFKGTEADLCAAFVERVQAEGYRVVPECSGWDMLVVDRVTGEQIGIQAKLRAGLDVLAQAMPSPYAGARDPGPDVVAVLVPESTASFDVVAGGLGLYVFTWGRMHVDRGRVARDAFRLARRHERPGGRCWIPEDGIEVAIPCGVPGPKTISPWKIGAAKLCRRLRAGETLTREDFKSEGIHPSRWLSMGWVVQGEKRGRYVLGGPERGGHPLPDVRMPEVVEALARKLDVASALA